MTHAFIPIGVNEEDENIAYLNEESYDIDSEDKNVVFGHKGGSIERPH